MDLIPVKRDAGAPGISLPIVAVVGIALGGFLVLFGILTTIAIFIARRRHQREKRQVSELEVEGQVKAEKKSATQPRPPEASFEFSRRLSYNPFLPLEGEPVWNDWTGENDLGTPPKRKSKHFSAPRGPFRISGMRDSWPLVSNIPLSLMPQSSSTIQLNNVAAPGYEIFTEPKWPKRTASRNSRTTVSVSRESPRKRPDFNGPYPPTRKPHKRGIHVRSASENQLSTILRSTSQRLKAANKNPLTRTLTTLNRTPGSPPIQPLPTLPKGNPSESREQLIESDHDESVASSICDILRSPSPAKRSPRKSGQIYSRTEKSPTPSAASEDSLCVAATPDLIIPAALTSPSKNGMRGDQRHRMRISSAEAKGLSAPISRDSKVSTLVAGKYPNLKRSLSLSAPRRISLSSDPFFSEVKSSTPFIPGDMLLGPRPLYIRKTTFGTDRTSQRPRSQIFPLQHISGNAQASSNKPIPPPHLIPVLGGKDQNPFQWSPQGTMQTRSTSTPPSRRRGHKRSKVVRISQIPRPMSVAVVPEETEEEVSQLRFSTLTSSSVHRFSALEPMQGPSPAPLLIDGRRQSARPPSVATFNPSLTDLTSRAGDNSPTLEMQEIMDLHSPMLAENNYHAESPITSEEDFFARASQSPISTPRSQSQQPSPSTKRHSRTMSAENLFPSSPQQGKLVSFPPPDLSLTSAEAQTVLAAPRPSPRPLPQISTIYSPAAPPMFMQQPNALALPLPPLLTITIPGHLTGPRAEPTKRASDQTLGRSVLSPPQISTPNSIGILGRMNSDNSTPPTPISNQTSKSVSPQIGIDFQIARESTFSQGGDENRGRSRGSKNNYLSIEGSNSSPSFLLSASQTRSSAPGTKQTRGKGPDKRDSHRVYRKRRRRRKEEVENANVDQFLKGRGLIPSVESKLTPVKEVRSSPASTPGSGLKTSELNPVNAQQNPRNNNTGGAIMMLAFPTLTPSGASNSGNISISQSRQQQRQNQPTMSTMMGIGTTADFFNVEIKEADPSAFDIGSDSDSGTNTETTEELTLEDHTHIVQLSQAQIQLKDQAVKTSEEEEREQEQNDLLALYSHSPTPKASISPKNSSSTTTTSHPSAPITTNPHTTLPARWSDATPKPPPPARSVRRESKMEHPSPKTPPRWVWGPEGLGLDDSGVKTPSLSERASVAERKDGFGRSLRGERLGIEGDGEVERNSNYGVSGVDTPKSLGVVRSRRLLCWEYEC